MEKLCTMKKVVAALALLLLMSGSVLADDIKIESVSYHGDTNTVKTNKANTKVKITRVDGDGNTLWTLEGTTDGEGKIPIKSGYMLIKEELKAEVVPEAPQVAQGVVVPDEIGPSEPLSFAVTGGATVEGEVVTLQTAEGIVVQQGTADKYGRVFLEAGLPAGAYLVTLATHDGQPSQPVGEIQVKQRPSDALERPWAHPPQPMQLRNAPRAIKLREPFSLTGHGFSPNCADMQANFTGAGQTQSVPVLAATEDQLKLAPVGQLPPGVKELSVTNKATGQSTEPAQVLIYDMHGHLERRKLTSGGDQTQLVVTTQPENLPLRVQASVVSGPVDFGGGRKEAQAITSDGQAIFLVHAERGAGPFKLAYELASLPFGFVQDGNGSPIACGPVGVGASLPFGFVQDSNQWEKVDPCKWLDGLPEEALRSLANALKAQVKPGSEADAALDGALGGDKVDTALLCQAIQHIKLVATLPDLAWFALKALATSPIPVLHEAATLLHIVEGGHLLDKAQSKEAKAAAEKVKKAAEDVKKAKEAAEQAKTKQAEDELKQKNDELKNALDELNKAISGCK